MSITFGPTFGTRKLFSKKYHKRELKNEHSQSVTNCHIFQLVAICHQLVFLAKVKTYFFYYLSSELPLR